MFDKNKISRTLHAEFCLPFQPFHIPQHFPENYTNPLGASVHPSALHVLVHMLLWVYGWVKMVKI